MRNMMYERFVKMWGFIGSWLAAEAGIGDCVECGHPNDKHDFSEAWDNCSEPGCNCGNNVGR